MKKEKLKTALIGEGKIGKRILKHLSEVNHKADSYDIHNISNIKDKEYDLIFLTTPMKSVKDIRSLIKNEPIVITTIKGINENKTIGDFFKNIISLNGYYTPENFEPKICYENENHWEIIEKIFPNHKKHKVTISEATAANYLKNMYLVVFEKFGEEIIIEDISKLEINNAVKELLIEDIKKCKELKSRNYMFSKMFYRDNISMQEAIKTLGLVEGIDSFINSDKFHSPLLTEVREEIIKEIKAKDKN